MRPVAADEGRQVALPVGVKELVVVAGLLAHAPGVEGFVQHIQPQPVAGFDESRRRRVVGRAHSVEADGLQRLQLAHFEVVERYRPRHAVIVVQAAALELGGPAVDAQPVHRVHLHGAHAEQHRILVGHRGFGRAQVGGEHTLLGHPGVQAVEVRRPGLPQRRFFQHKAQVGHGGLAGVDLQYLGAAGHGLAASFRREPDFHLGHARFAGFVAHIHFGLQVGEGSRTVLPVQAAGPGKEAVRGQMQLGAVYQPHAAEQPRAGVPAGIGLHTGVEVDGDAVFFAKGQVGRQAHGERDIAVVLQRGPAAVHLDGGVHHRAIQLQKDFLPGPGSRDIDKPGVVGGPGRVKAAGRPGGGVGGNVRLDHIVVRQVHDARGVPGVKVLGHDVQHRVEAAGSEPPAAVQVDRALSLHEKTPLGWIGEESQGDSPAGQSSATTGAALGAWAAARRRAVSTMRAPQRSRFARVSG